MPQGKHGMHNTAINNNNNNNGMDILRRFDHVILLSLNYSLDKPKWWIRRADSDA